MYAILILVGLIAGFLSGSVGFGGGMILLPVITYFYGVEVAVPVSTIAQLLSNLSRVGMGKNTKFDSIRKLQNGKNPNMQTRNGHYLTGSGLFHLYDYFTWQVPTCSVQVT